MYYTVLKYIFIMIGYCAFLSSHAQAARDDKAINAIKQNTSVLDIRHEHNAIQTCLQTSPYSITPVMEAAGHIAPIIAKGQNNDIKQLSIQPHFSGLKGPKITLMRKDIERAAITKKGSAAEIYHNATIRSEQSLPCYKGLTLNWDVEINHKVDAWESNDAPLYQSDIIVNNRIHFAGYFVATISGRYRLYDNLDDDPNLRLLNRTDPVRQDVYGYSTTPFNLNRTLLSGFVTPADDLYVAAHAGYLEEMFFGLGGEFLYRPHDKNYAIGAEVWGTAKRVPYAGHIFALDTDNRQTSALLNIWYDLPMAPLTIGLSGGRFLDGDTGYQIRTRYSPSPGWRIEGYATHSTQSDQTISKQGDENWIFGARLTMPLGDIRYVPDNSKQTVSLEPFARDHGQRLDNAYPLYDMTDPWQTKELYKYWNRVSN